MAIACALKAQDASVFKYQDTKQISDINNLTGNGVFGILHPGEHTSTLLQYNSSYPSSTGLFQMETFFNGDIRFRSKIDNMQWSAWKTIWTTQNFNADDYMTRKLDVWNTDAAKKERFFFATNGTTYFKGYGSTPFDWWGENGSLMKMSGNGNIGLGTDPSQEKLNVAGPIRSGIMSFGSTGDEYVAVSAKNILNVGYDRHGSILIGSNLFLDNGTLYTAKSHPTMSGAAIAIPGNGHEFQGSVIFYTKPPSPATEGQTYTKGPAMIITATGDLAIGTNNTFGYKLAVAGNTITESLKVKKVINWPDYVFHDNYQLPSLQSVADFITVNKHLPEIPPATEMETKGMDVAEINKQLLKKVEELTLYLIEQDKQIKALQAHSKRMEDILQKMSDNHIR
ncbi:hypothetical protein CK934_22745 [Chitinophaga sp. MD30]|nr:hypothetical protein CK934_22745 [Chitinophaga sp. MD30]